MNSCRIPKIIHQIAPIDKNLWHPLWHECQQSWLEHFKDFEYKLWNDKEDIDNFVHTNYPEFSNLYYSFPIHIMRIDFVRLCFLHKFGGIYADMDYFVYKNFYSELKKEVGFLENLTEEYTSARFENSLMYSDAGNQLLYELMKYTKTCFIHHRNLFNKNNDNWRSAENNKIINNTTGSGMISEGVKFFQKYFDIDVLDCKTFNNRPASYDSSFTGKHVHSLSWGNEHSNHIKNKILIKENGSMGWISKEEENSFFGKKINPNDFNFFWDYSNSQYLKHDNLQYIKELVKNDS